MESATLIYKRKPGRPRKTPSETQLKKLIQLRVPENMRSALERLATKHAADLSEEVRNAIRERLERHELWPVDQP